MQNAMPWTQTVVNCTDNKLCSQASRRPCILQGTWTTPLTERVQKRSKTWHWESERNLLGVLGTCNCFSEVLFLEDAFCWFSCTYYNTMNPTKPALISYHILTKGGTKHNLMSKNCEFREVRLPSISALIDSCAFSIIIHSRDWSIVFHTNCLSTKELQ